jgi:ADP-heptose:LPS heptosyltransferase
MFKTSLMEPQYWLNFRRLRQGPDFDAGDQAFLDSAAVIQNLDLVITSDTALAHLAGALGRPCWVALQKIPDWRWLLERSDTPWYAKTRLFRQKTRGDWAGVFAEIASATRALAREREIV